MKHLLYKKINFAILIFFLFAASCKTDAPKPISTDTGEAEDKVSYLALGDSYTIGESVAIADRFPVQLASALEEKGVKIADPVIIAKTGWTTANLKKGITDANLAGKTFDLVSLLIGVNNQYQGRNLDEYKSEFKELLEQAIKLAKGKKENVIVLSIPDYGYTPFGRSRQSAISAEIDQFNAINKQITESMAVNYYDITAISRNGLSDPSLVAPDGLHPSGKMYKQWVDLVLADVLQKVNKP